MRMAGTDHHNSSRNPSTPFHLFMKTLLIRLAVFALCLNALPLLAQRESFDTTVTRKADVIILEMENPTASGTDKSATMLRNGLSYDGQSLGVNTSLKAVTFDNIFFKLDSTELRDDASRLQVAEIAAALKSPKLRDVPFLIEGHTCDLGENDYNLKLSAQRAEAIRKLLIKQGIAEGRLASLGFGESEIVDPVKKGDSRVTAETRRMKSRRVALRRIMPKPASAKK